MLDGTCINNGGAQTIRLLGREAHDSLPKYLLVALHITLDILALETSVRFVHIDLVRLCLCSNRGPFPIEQQLVIGVGELRVGVHHAPEHVKPYDEWRGAKWVDARMAANYLKVGAIAGAISGGLGMHRALLQLAHSAQSTTVSRGQH